MIGVGILDGDVIIVRRQSTAQQRDIVVALIEDEAPYRGRQASASLSTVLR